MSARAAGPALLVLASCVGEGWKEPVTDEEVITSLEIHTETPGAPALADGHTRLVVDITTSGNEGHDTTLTAKLEITDGAWVFPDSGGSKVATLKLLDTSASATVIVGDRAGPFEVKATVEGYTRTDSIDLRAPVSGDILTGLTITPVIPSARVLADGQTRFTVALETAGLVGRMPVETAKLEVANGKWELPDSGTSGAKTITISSDRVEAVAVAGTTPGPMTITATVDGFTRVAAYDLTALTLDDVIASVTPVPPTGGAVADGVTLIDVEVCATDRQAAIPSTQVELRTSEGRWASATSGDLKMLTLPIADACVEAALIPGVVPQPVVITATIGQFTRAATVTLAPSPLSRVICTVSGGLSNGAGSPTVSATLVALAPGGKPSLGTVVTYQAVVEPATAAGYFASPTAVLSTGDVVGSQFFAYGFPTRITFTATATAGTQPPVTCEPVVIVAPPPPPT